MCKESRVKSTDAYACVTVTPCVAVRRLRDKMCDSNRRTRAF